MAHAAERLAVVLGATGNIGFGAVKALLSSGWSVVAPVRDLSKSRGRFSAEALRTATDRLRLVEAEMSSEEGASKVMAAVDAYPPAALQAVVSTMGPWWQVGPLHSLTRNTYEDAFTANVTSHFQGWSTLGRRLIDSKRDAAYIFMTGAAADYTSSITSVTAASLVSFARVATAEARKASPALRVYTIYLSLRVEDDATFAAQKAAGKLSPSVTNSSHFGQLFPALAEAKRTPSDKLALTEMGQLRETVVRVGGIFTEDVAR